MAKILVLPHGGYGLGNELIPLGKAWLIAKECNGRMLDISWRDNKRNYKKYFRTSIYDPFLRRLLWKTLPRIAFPVRLSSHDIGQEIKNYCETNNLYNPKKTLLVTVTGIDGGPETVRDAKDYLLARLLSTKYTLDNLRSIGSALKKDRLTIGIHVRLGDFWELGSRQYSGLVNTRLPIEWYIKVIKNLIRNLGGNNLQFILSSDEPNSQALCEMRNLCQGNIISQISNSDVSDLIALSQSDLLICSSSTYSMWAATLGNPYYVWYKPNLLEAEDGLFIRIAQVSGIESPEERLRNDWPKAVQKESKNKPVLNRAANPSISALRGHPVGDCGEIPQALLCSLQARIEEKNPSYDIIRGGVIPLGS